MDSAHMVTSVTQTKGTMLVIDRENLFGQHLLEHLQGKGTLVFVSKTTVSAESEVIHIPFSHTIPTLPEGEYTHIFFVWDEESKEMLAPLIQKADESKGKLFLIVTKDIYQEKKIPEDVFSKVTTIVIGDLLKQPTEKGSVLDQWLSEIKQTVVVPLWGMGLWLWYPVLYDDAVSCLIACGFSHAKKGERYLASSKHSYTSIAIAHALQKADPLLRLSLRSEGEAGGDVLTGQALLPDEYNALEKIKEVYQSLPAKKQKTIPQKIVTPSQFVTSSPKRKKKLSPFVVLIYLFLVVLVAPLIVSLGFGGFGVFFAKSSVSDVKSGNFSAAYMSMNTAHESFVLASSALDIVSVEAVLIGQEGKVAGLASQLQAGRLLTKSLSEGLLSVGKFADVLQGKSLTPQQDTQAGVNALKAAIQSYQEVPFEALPSPYRSQLLSYQPGVAQLSNFVDVLPDILGANGKRSYLLLFQNNMELRPGGGFIGSYGLLHLDQAKVKDFSIHDVYDADGQLKGHIEPPFAIRRYIPIVHLFLRDSNFDVDFTKNAQTAAYMLSQETGERVDGVVGIDVSFLKTLLSMVGSVYVPSYNITVTSDNVFLLTEQHAEKNTFAGSTQKKDFLRALFGAILQKIQQKQVSLSSKTPELLLAALRQKDVVMAFANPTTQAPFTYADFSSSLWDGREESAHTFTDFLGINEANLGINKANYFLKRSLSQAVSISSTGLVSETLTLSYTNTSQKGGWPGGIYKNYLRVILPSGASLTKVTIGGADQSLIPAITDPTVYEAKSFVEPKGLEIEKTEENGKTLFGFFIEVPEASSQTVAISYVLPKAFPIANATPTYSLELFKQPGMDSSPYSLTIDYPQNLMVLGANEKVTKATGHVAYQGALSEDKMLQVSFTHQ